jgi:hypothetical protein
MEDTIYIPGWLFEKYWDEETLGSDTDGYVAVELFSRKTRKLIQKYPDIFFHVRDILHRQCCLHSLIKTRQVHQCGWCYDTVRIRKIASWYSWAPPRSAYADKNHSRTYVDNELDGDLDIAPSDRE